jgi:N-acetylglucosamine-6-sulfatase
MKTLNLAILAVPLLFAAPADGSPMRARPNLVVIMADDLDPGSLEVMVRAGLMPHFESLFVKGGVKFPNCFATNPICAPSRATFLTGRYSHNHGVHHNGTTDGGVLGMDHASTIATWLQRGGYRTGHVGKFLNGYGTSTARTWVPPGWDDWQGLVDPTTYTVYDYILNDNGRLVPYGNAESDYQTDVLARRAARFIDVSNLVGDAKPFFLTVTPLAPHVEVKGGIPLGDVWSWTIRPAPRHIGTTEMFPLPQPASFNEADVTDKPQWVQNRPTLTPGNVASLTRKYRDRLASLRAVDDMVGTIVDALRRTGELDRTVLMFTADNGYLYGEHRLPEKMYAYDESVRIPLYIRAPGIPGGAERRAMVLNNDLAPTLAALGQILPGHVVDGRSLVPILTGQDPGAWRKRFLVEHWTTGFSTKLEAPTYSAVRTLPEVPTLPDRLYVEYRNGEWGAVEHYDRTIDPHELESRHADPARAWERDLLKAQLGKLRFSSGPWVQAAEQ